MSDSKSRRPPLHALVALDIIAQLGKRSFSFWEFRMATPSQWKSGSSRLSLTALERRGWIIFENETITLTDAGYLAATTGEGIPPAKKSERRASRQRMPHGLF
jgi:hypothetical protein